MDKSWMDLMDKCDPRFSRGILTFIEFVKRNKPFHTTHPCPCRRCRLHHEKLPLSDIQKHLFVNGMMREYTTWTYHGEEPEASSSLYTERMQHVYENLHGSTMDTEDDSYYQNPTIEMLNDAFPFCNGHDDDEDFMDEDENENEHFGKDAFDKYQRLILEAQKPIYKGSTKTVLGTILRAMEVKVKNGWSDKSFDDHLTITRELLPTPNNYPGSYREIKKLLRNMGMGYKTFHACEWGCVLYYDEYKDYERCPVCKESRYVENGNGGKTPKKVVRYFPLTPRLQRFFMSPHISKQMRWHGERKVDANLIRHPADSDAWHEFDEDFPEFSKEIRNVRLGLSTDGFNPFGASALGHSTWPIVVIPYNLPPSMCMKKDFNILTMLISGPKSPGKCLNVFMRPLIDELIKLWGEGVVTFDRHSRSSFNLKAAVLWTISDFPGLGMLGGLKCKGYKACPMCLDELDPKNLERRMCYIGHRRWLPKDHPWRIQGYKFDGKVESRDAPIALAGAEVFYAAFSHIDEYPELTLHKDLKTNPKKKLCWTHMSIFYELPYWSSLRQPYSLDVMHIEKNVFDNIFGTILGIKGKTRDDISARQGLEILGVREELWWDGVSTKVSQAPYTVLPEERDAIFDFIKDAKYPYGYAGSLRNKINLDEKKFQGLKTHDCHVMLQRLLPVFIRPYLPHYVIQPLISLSRWFQKLCCRELTRSDVSQMKEDIVFILCKLEMVFPPAFFTIMVHLMIHLPDQVLLKGPVHYNWMYPIER